jgi:hypothetical protein
MSAAEIHCELCVVYSQNIMSEGTKTMVFKMFKDGRTDANQKIYERQRFTISELLCEFPQISRTVLYEIIIVRLSYHHKFCAR